MRLVTAQQMRECDRRTIAGEGGLTPMPSRELMERAGWGIYAALCQHFAHLGQRAILVFCGPGNNGGDGFVVARHLHAAGRAPCVLLIGGTDRMSADAAEQTRAYRAAGGRMRVIGSEDRLEAEVAAELRPSGRFPPLVLDALLGTGSRGEPQGLIGAAVHSIRRMRAERGAEVLAVDLPTGMEADTGRVPGEAVEADLTVTMAFLKVGFLFHPGRAHVGRVRVVDIGIPGVVADRIGTSLWSMTRGDVRALLPHRAPDAYKSRVGRILVVGGSPGLTGAPSLAGLAAQRTGSGLITLALPAGLNLALEAKLTEVMTLPCPETAGGSLSLAAEGRIAGWIERTDVWALGPGLGADEESIALVRRLAAQFPGPVVVDADGLRAFSGADCPRPAGAPPAVLTPHPGEMARLLGEGHEAPAGPPYETARRYAQARGCVLVLKGAPTVVAEPGGEVWVNPTGNAGLATGGSGDVLTGIIASLLGQGLGPAEAARVGVYLHGAAADRLAETRGVIGYAPTDLIEMLPGTLQALSGLPPCRPNEIWTDAAGFSVP